MPEDPYSWTAALRSALRRNRREAHNRYLQLATVRGDGSPAVRTLVFRAFDEERARLDMVTDTRSAKADEIDGERRAEIAWYFTHTREQFRLRGDLRLLDQAATDQELRGTLWAALSDAARSQFFWPHPGRPIKAAAENPGVESSTAGGPPASFAALCLHVTSVDHLQLRGDPQRRRRSFIHGDAWHAESVNP